MSPSRADSINCRSILTDRKVVPDEQIKLFCDILRIKYDRGEGLDDELQRQQYRNRVRGLVRKLNFPLAKPASVLNKLHVLPKQSEYTHLCDLHQELNADFVHQWFKYIQLEVGARLEPLRSSSRGYIEPIVWDNAIKPLTRIHNMWLAPGQLEETFGDFVLDGFENTIEMMNDRPQSDRCEACMLARLGSRAYTLWALRCVIKSRVSLVSQANHPKWLRLLRLIEPWLELWNERFCLLEHQENEFSNFKGNTRLADTLYEKRQEIKLMEHRHRRNLREKLAMKSLEPKALQQYVVALDEKAIKDEVYDAENDIIDTYAALRATQRASAMLSTDIIAGKIPQYPAYRKSSSATTTEDKGKARSPYKPNVDKAYLESRYTFNTVLNNERAIFGPDAALDDLQAGTQRPPQRYDDCTPDAIAAQLRDTRISTATVWPIRVNGANESRIELLQLKMGHDSDRARHSARPGPPSRSRDQSKSNTPSQTYANPPQPLDRISEERSERPTSQDSYEQKHGRKYRPPTWFTEAQDSAAALRRQSENKWRASVVTVSSTDSYDNPRGGAVRNSDVSMSSDRIADGRASVVSSVSGYSQYQRQNNGAPRYDGSDWQSPSSAASRLSRPFDQPTPANDLQREYSRMRKNKTESGSAFGLEKYR